MTAPIGAVVSLYMDTLRTIEEADVIRTPSGRSYRVASVRRQAKGIHVGRWHMQCVVIDPATIQADDHVIDLIWYRR